MKSEFGYILLLIATVSAGVRRKHFDFDIERISHNVHHTERYPLYIPGKCPQYQILYPEKENDWVCDCMPGYIYDPETKACYEAFHQGPCSKGMYLVYSIAEAKAICLKNPCHKDGHVKLHHECWELGVPGGPCHNIEQGVLGIDFQQLAPDCVKNVNQENRDEGLALITTPNRNCYPGGLRSSIGKCKPSIDFRR